MTKRYRYRRMTGEAFGEALNDLDMTLNDFSRISGSSYKRARKWIDVQEDIPPHVPVLIALMALPGGKERALQTALSYVITEDQE